MDLDHIGQLKDFTTLESSLQDNQTDLAELFTEHMPTTWVDSAKVARMDLAIGRMEKTATKEILWMASDMDKAGSQA